MLDSLRRGPAAFVVFGVFVAVILCWLVWDYSAVLTEQRVRDDESARRYSENAVDRIEDRCPLALAPKALRDCIFDEIESAEDQQRSERDLDAQESVARSTRAMMLTGFIGLFIGMGSIGLIWGTLRETRRMANDAMKTAKAADEANRITRTQARPWVVLRRDVPCIFSDYGHAGSLEFSYAFEKSPAFNIRLEIALWKSNSMMGPIELWPTFIENCRARAKRHSSLAVPVLHPGERMEFEYGGLVRHKGYINGRIIGGEGAHVEGNKFGAFIVLTCLMTEFAPHFLLKAAY